MVLPVRLPSNTGAALLIQKIGECEQPYTAVSVMSGQLPAGGARDGIFQHEMIQ
jgi:hypothetical protein